MEKTKLERLEDLISRIKEISKRQEEVIESMAGFQLQAMDAGLQAFSDRMAEPHSNASKNVELVKSLSSDIEIERNRIKNEAG